MDTKVCLTDVVQDLVKQRGLLSRMVEEFIRLHKQVESLGDQFALLPETVLQRQREERVMEERINALRKRQKDLAAQLATIIGSLAPFKVSVGASDETAARAVTCPDDIASLAPDQVKTVAWFELWMAHLETVVNLFQLVVARMKATAVEHKEYQRDMTALVELLEQQLQAAGGLKPARP